jgi:ketol-acid reductoisomerase
MSMTKTGSGPQNAPLEPLAGKTVAVLGFGNQGAAHALNLRDSGVSVLVANRPDTANGRRAVACGFDPLPLEEGVERADLTIIALPDEAQPAVWTDRIAPHLKPGGIAGFLHGFSIRYRLIRPPDDIGVIMVAPKGPGRTLRQRFEGGQGIPCLFAVHQDSPAGDAEAIGRAWAAGIGCARAAIIPTTFADETETDLFGEQAVLCGGMTQLVLAAFETLVEAGYAPELAYMECCQEVKQVADLVYERGLAGMTEAISNTAEFGTYRAGPDLIDEAVRRRMRAILEEVRDGRFAAAMREDYAAGFPWFSRQRRALAEHPIETAGQAVRSWMPWLGGAD